MLLPSSKRTAGFHQLKGLVWWDGWGLTANWTMKWHGVQGRAPGSNSLDRIARFALHRVNTAPKLPKTNKTHFSENKFTKVALPLHQTDRMCKWTQPFLGDGLPEVTQKPCLGPGSPLLAVPSLRELESPCRVSMLRDADTAPTVCFSGVFRGLPGGQQQFATQTLRIHLLGIEFKRAL